MDASLPAEFVAVTEGDVDDAVELPVDPDGSLLLSTLCAQFPGASGLKYKPEGAKAFRGVRLEDGKLSQPAGGWNDHTYHVVFPKEAKENTKRKIADDRFNPDDDDSGALSGGAAKLKRVDLKKCTDLIVLGIPYKCTEADVREYFETFGELAFVEIKKNADGTSKGFGFVRYSDFESQLKALNQSHTIEGRKCEVKIPASKGDGPSPSRRVFVGRLPESVTREELREFFSKYGDIEDVYIPKPFRQFAFVTFVHGHVAPSLIGEELLLNGNMITVNNALPKGDKRDDHGYGSSAGSTSMAASAYSATPVWGPPSTYGSSSYAGYGYGPGYGGAYSYGTQAAAPSRGTGSAAGAPRAPGPGGGNLATGMGNLNLNSVNPDMLAAAHAALLTAIQQQQESAAGGDGSRSAGANKGGYSMGYSSDAYWGSGDGTANGGSWYK